MTSLQFKIVNFVIFQLIWVAAVIFQYQGLWACVLLLALHFVISPQRKTDLQATYKALGIGIIVDLLLMSFGVYVFPDNHFPLWLACLWMGFVLTLRHSLQWLLQKPIYWQCALGAFGGTVSYLSGVQLGAVKLGIDLVYAAPLIVIIWALLVPLLLRMVNGEQHVSLA
ncbi:MAG: DUF2878 domain-containing protein [Aestuariibacter sp.]